MLGTGQCDSGQMPVFFAYMPFLILVPRRDKLRLRLSRQKKINKRHILKYLCVPKRHLDKTYEKIVKIIRMWTHYG